MSRAHEKPPPVRFLADIGNGISGFSRAAVFWATVLPAVMEYQKVNKWKEEQPKDDGTNANMNQQQAKAEKLPSTKTMESRGFSW